MQIFKKTLIFLGRTLLVCCAVFITLLWLEPNADQYLPVQQSGRTGAGLRQLKRMIERRRPETPDEVGKNHELIHDAFEDILSSVENSVVVVLCDRQPAAFGTAISSNLVITKASEMSGRIICRLPSRKRVSAKMIAQDKSCDMALLQLSDANLVPVQFASQSTPPIGTFVAVPTSRDGDPLSIGIVSAKQRKAERDDALLGIFMEQAPEGPKIAKVFHGSAAERIGLEVDDIVTHVADGRIIGRDELIQRIQQYRPGETVDLKVLREGRTLSLSAPLGRMDDVLAAEQGFDGHLGGPLNVRRSDFPDIIQHDCIVPAHKCGGPLTNLDGQVLGVNIARSGRVSTYALPAALVRQRIEELGWLSGSLANSR